MIYNKQHRYQLIQPLLSNKIYQTTSFKKGVAKCYSELKNYGPITANEFVVMDIDSFEKYSFAINHKNNLHMSGGNITHKNTDIEEIREHNNSTRNKEIDENGKEIERGGGLSVEAKIDNLEGKYKLIESDIKEIKSIVFKTNSHNKLDIDVTADKLPTTKPKTISQQSPVELPHNKGASYDDNLNLEPQTDLKLSNNEIYRANIKKLHAANIIEQDQDEKNDCTIM
jgi:hypothetical protein